ncbi:MAG: hypothetical protein ABFS37_14955 [Acidobacteriota bacterium]
MTTLLMTFVIFLVAVLALVAIALITGKPPKGACGGVEGDACSCSAGAGESCETSPEHELIQIDLGVSVRGD